MTTENAEVVTQTGQVNPAPAQTNPAATGTAPAPANSNPATSPAEDVALKKQIAAHIKARQEIRGLKRQLATAQSSYVPPPAAASTTDPAAQAQQPATTIQQPAPGPAKPVRDIEAESAKAIEALSTDKDVAKVPGAILDIMALVDSDPRLSELHDIDPTIAFREAKSIWAEKSGIGAAPAVAKSAPTTGGIGGGEKQDLEAMVAACEKLPPGSKEFFTLTKKIRAELAKMSAL